MFSEETLKTIQAHENEIDMLQQRLYRDQMALNEAYQREWADMNGLIEAGQWDESAVYEGNCYGLKVGEEKYIFQLDAPLPFLPNSFYRSFDKTYKEFYATKLLLSLQLRDVIEQIGEGFMDRAATLFIRHYYHNIRTFDLDNKSKQVIINTLRKTLLKNDTIDYLKGFREDAIYNEPEIGSANHTMLYLYPYSESLYMETKIVSKYPRIDNEEGVITGKLCQTISRSRPSKNDIAKKLEESRKQTNNHKTLAKMDNNGINIKNFM